VRRNSTKVLLWLNALTLWRFDHCSALSHSCNVSGAPSNPMGSTLGLGPEVVCNSSRCNTEAVVPKLSALRINNMAKLCINFFSFTSLFLTLFLIDE